MGPFKSIVKNREIIIAIAQRHIQERYKGSLLGGIWSIATPLILLTIYTFFFSIIFEARWESTNNSTANFALILFIGLMIYNFFTECTASSTSIITNNVNYVKKVIFPLESLVVSVSFTALFNLFINYLIWCLFYLITGGSIGFNLLAPLLIIPPLLFTTLGICWVLASLGTFYRDTIQVVALVNTALLFLSPIFYPSDRLPEEFALISIINPLAMPIAQARSVLLFGDALDHKSIIIYTMISIIILYLGYYWFKRSSREFANVL